jgi:hypothetical protein
MLPPYLQLKLIPRWSLPSRLLVELLALRLARLLEAPEDHSYRFISSVFSTDPLAGSGSVLPLRQLVHAVVLFGVVLGSSFNSDFLSSACKSFVVLVPS